MPPFGSLARRLKRRGRHIVAWLASAARRRSGWILTIALCTLYVAVLLPVAAVRRHRMGRTRGWINATASTRDLGGFWGQY